MVDGWGKPLISSSSAVAWPGSPPRRTRARDGARVAVVERAEELGGSARYAGYLWTAATDELLAEADPDGDPALRHTLVDGYADAVAFARSLDVPLGDEVVLLRYGRGRRIDTAAYLGACAKVVTDAGGEILCSVEADTLVVDGGEVRGVDVRTADGARRLESVARCCPAAATRATGS